MLFIFLYQFSFLKRVAPIPSPIKQVEDKCGRHLAGDKPPALRVQVFCMYIVVNENICQPGRLTYLHYCKNPIPYNLSASQRLTLCFLCALCDFAVNYYPSDFSILLTVVYLFKTRSIINKCLQYLRAEVFRFRPPVPLCYNLHHFLMTQRRFIRPLTP